METTSSWSLEKSIISSSSQASLKARSIPLMPIHSHCLSIPDADPHIFNTILFYEVPSNIDQQALFLATKAIIAHHDALRLRFVPTDRGWQAYISDDDIVPFSFIDLSSIEPAQQSKNIEDIAEQFQRSLNLTHGPLLRGVHINTGKYTPGRLLLIFHHFACDAFSKNILRSDFATAYDKIQNHEKPVFIRKSSSIEDFSKSLLKFAHTDSLLSEVDYWITPERQRLVSLPLDFPNGLTVPTIKKAIHAQWNEAETRTLIHLARYKISVRSILLAALFEAYTRWTGEKYMLIELMNHGRIPPLQNIDLLHTVGWLNELIPFLVDSRQQNNTRELVYAIEGGLRSIPNNGLGYTILRHMRNDQVGRLFRSLPQPQLFLNYQGRSTKSIHNSSSQGFTSLITPASEQIRGIQSQQRRDPVYIWLTAHIVDYHLHILWEYQANLFHKETIEKLIETFKEALHDILLLF